MWTTWWSIEMILCGRWANCSLWSNEWINSTQMYFLIVIRGKRINKLVTGGRWPHRTHLKMKMNRISSEKNIATLSIVRSMTNNCRRRLGMKRTNLRIRNNRNVRKTDSPELPLAPSPPINDWHSSMPLKSKTERREEKKSVLMSFSGA